MRVLLCKFSAKSSICYANFDAANFEEAVKYAPDVIPNTDLEDLGFVLLACMERRARPQLRDINYIRE